MLNTPRSEIIEITGQNSNPGYKNNVGQGSCENKVATKWTVESMILNLIQCMTQFMYTMQNTIQDLIKTKKKFV